jgi:hypothetical protein
MLVRGRCKHYENTHFGIITTRCSACATRYEREEYAHTLIDIVSDSPLSHSYIRMNMFAKETRMKFYR